MTPLRPRTLTRARIEIIPLIDVIFFLLATFVLFTLSLNKLAGINLTFPITDPRPIIDTNKPQPVILTVLAGNAVLWDGAPIASGDLPGRLALYRESSPDPRVLIGGDIHASYGAAIQALDAVRAAGITQVSIETRVRPAGR